MQIEKMKPIALYEHEVKAVLTNKQVLLLRPIKFRYPAVSPPSFLPTCRFKLWVREVWAVAECYNSTKPSHLPLSARNVDYRADDPKLHMKVQGKWRSSIYMPQWASRITLRVMSVEVIQIQDVGEYACIQAGVPSGYSNFSAEINMWSDKLKQYFRGPTYKSVFAQLWNSINADCGYGWEVNPWVWAITTTKEDS